MIQGNSTPFYLTSQRTFIRWIVSETRFHPSPISGHNFWLTSKSHCKISKLHIYMSKFNAVSGMPTVCQSFYNHFRKQFFSLTETCEDYSILVEEHVFQGNSGNTSWRPELTLPRPYYRPPTFLSLECMMTSSNGNIFRVTGHLCGEFTGPRWIPRTKASDAELWCFLWSVSE